MLMNTWNLDNSSEVDDCTYYLYCKKIYKAKIYKIKKTMKCKTKIVEIGSWDLEDSSLLDDYAYYLYCKEIYEARMNYEHLLCVRQFTFKEVIKQNKGLGDGKYYSDAQIILRRNKINKIKNKNK